MTEMSATSGVRFGRATVATTVGDLLEQPVEALVYGANSRGVMGAGAAGAIRLAGGPEIEREAMALAPLEVGSAVPSGPGRLAERGIRAIIHATVNSVLGQPAKLDSVRRATEAALRVIDERRLRSVALPLIGSGTGPAQLDRLTVAAALVDEIVTYLRWASSRIERIVLVLRVDDDVPAIDAMIARARERSWVRRS